MLTVNITPDSLIFKNLSPQQKQHILSVIRGIFTRAKYDCFDINCGDNTVIVKYTHNNKTYLYNLLWVLSKNYDIELV